VVMVAMHWLPNTNGGIGNSNIDTFARKIANKFAFSLAYSYLCTQNY